MGILDFFRPKFEKIVNPRIFGMAYSQVAPDMKSDDYLKSYTSWVYTCVNAIADDVATIELELEHFEHGDWVSVQQNMVLDLLKNTNQFDTFSDLIIQTQSFLELDGNAFWYLPKGEATGKPGEIWTLYPNRVTLSTSEDKVVSGYIYTNQKGEAVPFTPDEIIHFKKFNPLNRFRGMGTVQASAVAIDIDNYSAQFNRNFFFNAAVPSAVLKTSGELTDEQFQRIKAEWDSRYTGTQNAHRLAILQNGLDYQPIGLSQKDMQFLEQRKFSRDEILAIFRIPKTILGISDDVNRANAETGDYVFAKRVIKPRMSFLVDRLNESLLPLFKMDDREWRFSFDDPVPENEDQEIRKYTASLTLGSAWMTPNEVRAEEGLPPIENGDSLLIPLNAMPLGAVITTQSKAVKKHLSPRQKAIFSIANDRVKWVVAQIKKREKKYDEIINSIIRDVISNLKESGIKGVRKSRKDDLIRIMFVGNDDHIHQIESETDDALTVSMARGGADTFRQLADKLDAGAEFSTGTERAVNWINQNGLDSAKKINDTVKEEMRGIISAGVDEGKSIAEIADDLSELTDTPVNRAERIARTEVLKGYEEGSLEGARQSGVVVGKSWLTAGDDLVDETCLSAESDGVIPLNATFSNGSSAPPEHPNCRCSLDWFTGDEVTFTMFNQVDAHLKAEMKKVDQELKKKEIESKEKIDQDSARILDEAKKKADQVIADAINSANAEKGKILDDLVSLRDKALEAEYEIKK